MMQADTKKWTASLALAMAIVASPLTHTAHAGEQPNLLVMSEDADRDAIPRNNRIFKRVERAFAEEMRVRGFAVFDETAVSLNITKPNRVRRDNAELITIARRIQDAPIDAIATFEIYASAEKNAYADITDLRLRIQGRLLAVKSGQSLGSYEVGYAPGELPPLPAKCHRECVLEHVGDQAKRIASDVGNVLATRLAALSPTDKSATPQTPAPALETTASDTAAPNAVLKETGGECTGLTQPYTLAFTGFDGSDLTRIEEYLVAFKGYDHHRPIRVDGVQSDYWYESCSDVARLNRNLRLMTEHMGIEARISLTGNRFDIEKLRQPANR